MALRTQYSTLIIFLLISGMVLPGVSLIESSSASEATFEGPTPLGTTAYHDYGEVVSELNNISADHSDITRLISIGKSYEGRDIWAMKVSDNPDVEEDEPELYYNGNHHAREWLTIEVCIYILNYLTDNYLINATITNIVDNRQIWVIPCVNPDGRVYDSDKDNPASYMNWRKTRSDNGDGSYGVDPNRNYDYMWGGSGASDVPSDPTYRGPEPFSEHETKAVRDFVRQHDFVFSISYHSYSQLILYPWGYTYNESEDDALFVAVTNDMANLITNKAGSAYPGYTPQQSSDLYPTSGTDDDWLYGELGIYAFCIELYPHSSDTGPAVSTPYNRFHPREDKVVPVCEDNIEAALYLAQIADNPFQALDYHVSLSAPIRTKSINQTETKAFTITVTNDGGNFDNYDLSTSAIPGWTINVAPPTMFLNSGSSGTTTLSVTVPSGESGGDYHIWVHATSQSDSSVTASLLITVQVPYLNDVGIQSIDTFEDGGSYPAAYYSIKSTAKNFGRNSQPEFNASLEITKLLAPITQTVFSDDMESGANGWQVMDLDGTISPDSWKQVTSASNSPTTSWWCGDSTQYSSNTVQLLVSPSFSLKDAMGANLTFYHKYSTEDSYDFCSVDVSDGSAWTTLVCYDGVESNFIQVVLDLKDFIGCDDVRIRFRFTSDEFVFDNGWYIDDVVVTAELPEETTVYGPKPTRTNGVMMQDDAQQLDWDYTFTEDGVYKIYATTLLETDELQSNNQSVVKIRIEPLFFQVESPFAGYRNLSKEPFENTIQTATTLSIASPGQYKIGGPNDKWISVEYAESRDLSGPWTFIVYGYLSSNLGAGFLYARVYSYSDSALLFQTSNDDEDVQGFIGSYHKFKWIYNVSGVTLNENDRYYVEIWLNATAGSGFGVFFTMGYDHSATPSGVSPSLNSINTGTFNIPVHLGWNLVSTPLMPFETSVPNVFLDTDGDTTWTAMQYYDAHNALDNWEIWAQFKPSSLNDPTDVDHKRGVWLYIPNASALGDGYINLSGVMPKSVGVELCRGWNLVGYPSLTSHNRTHGLNNLKFGKDVDSIWTYDAATYIWEEMGESDDFEPGKGYWIHSLLERTWEVPI